MQNLLKVFQSWRFWSVFLIGLGTAINDIQAGADWVSVLVKFVTVVAGGAAAVRTIDRFSDKV